MAAVWSGCTWVPLSPEGRGVLIASDAAVAACESIGTAHSKVAARAGPFRRSDWKVQEELENLARGEAARMGGDTIVPQSAPDAGRQSFRVYRCG